MIGGMEVDEGKDVESAVPIDGAVNRYSDGAGGVAVCLKITE